MCEAAQKLRDLPLAATARTMGLSGDRIEELPFSDDQEATEAWVGKEVGFIVGSATGREWRDGSGPRRAQ